MSFSNFLEVSLLDLAFGATPFTPSGTLYVALSSGNPLDDGSAILEPAAGSYARVAVTNDKDNWAGAESPTSQLYNVVPVTFPQATADWGLVTHFAVYDQDSGGNLYGAGELTSSRTILNGDTPSFTSGNLTITLD